MNEWLSTIRPTRRAALQLATLALATSLVGVGCSVAKRRTSHRADFRPGHLNVTLGISAASRCDAAALAVSGDLRIQGFDERALATISGAELSRGRSVRRELAPGLYSMSFVPNTDGQDVPPTHWTLRDPKVLSVSSGRSTELLVHLDALECQP